MKDIQEVFVGSQADAAHEPHILVYGDAVIMKEKLVAVRMAEENKVKVYTSGGFCFFSIYEHIADSEAAFKTLLGVGEDEDTDQ